MRPEFEKILKYSVQFFSYSDSTWCWFQNTTKLPFSTCYFPPFIIFSSGGMGTQNLGFKYPQSQGEMS